MTNAKKREHSTPHYNCDDESCDPAQVSCDLLTMSHDSNVDATTREWMSYLGRLLPASLDCPFHVSVQLNVDATHKCIEKICQLLVHLQGELFSLSFSLISLSLSLSLSLSFFFYRRRLLVSSPFLCLFSRSPCGWSCSRVCCWSPLLW